jgi:kynureninase
LPGASRLAITWRMMPIGLDEVRRWDDADALAAHRRRFSLPEGLIYLDGNSLGPLPAEAPGRMARVVQGEWGRGLIGSWQDAGWLQAPQRIGAKIARLLGAAADEVIAADSTSVNLFKLAAAAVMLRPGRTRLLTEAGNFPTDRHVLEGLVRLRPDLELVAVPAGQVLQALDRRTALLLLCHVHYRSGERHDMAAMNAAAREAGALCLWDLSHSAGAVPLSLAAAGADMAVGCGYKFLNGGPGAPAWLQVARHLQAEARSPLQGWMGHADPFGFSDQYQPAEGLSRFLAGTPGILGLAALEAGLDAMEDVDPSVLWVKSQRMFDLFDRLVAARCPGLERLTPRDPDRRGSQIAFRTPHAGAVMQDLIARGVVGDFRPPDVLRFGLTPLTTRFEDIWRAAGMLCDILETAAPGAVGKVA